MITKKTTQFSEHKSIKDWINKDIEHKIPIQWDREREKEKTSTREQEDIWEEGRGRAFKCVLGRRIEGYILRNMGAVISIRSTNCGATYLGNIKQYNCPINPVQSSCTALTSCTPCIKTALGACYGALKYGLRLKRFTFNLSASQARYLRRTEKIYVRLVLDFTASFKTIQGTYNR